MTKKRVALVAVLLVIAGFAWLLMRPAKIDTGPFEPTPEELEKLAVFQQPESWFLGQLQGPPEVIDGATMDPKFQYLAEQMRPVAPWFERLMPAIFANAYHSFVGSNGPVRSCSSVIGWVA